MKSFLVAFAFLLILTVGCGSGGGTKSGQFIDPASYYTGSQTAASVTDENAESISIGGFSGGSLAGALSSVTKSNSKNGIEAGGCQSIFYVAQLIKETLSPLDIVNNKVDTKDTIHSENYQISGDNGGTATFNIDFNETEESYSGTITYMYFASKGLVFHGTISVYGIVDPQSGQSKEMSLSFRELRLIVDDTTISLTGTLSWDLDYTTYTETLTMNMVLQDLASDKTYWYQNYYFVSVYLGGSLEQTITGRYYDHDSGFVDVTTITPLKIYISDPWPSLGNVLFMGTNNTSVSLNFFETSLLVAADTDGDGNDNLQVERETLYGEPVADAGPDQDVSQWTIVQLDGSNSRHAEDHPLSYRWSLISYPSYNPPELIDIDTATPSFRAVLTGTYEFSLRVDDGLNRSETDTVVVTVSPVPAQYPDSVEQKWHFWNYGKDIGKNGLGAADLNGDGVPEIIAGSSTSMYGNNDRWFVLRYAESGYEKIWRSPKYDSYINSIQFEDMNGDLIDDVIVLLIDKSIHIYDGPTLNVIKTFWLSEESFDQTIIDIDTDGTKEIITTNGTGVYVYSASSGSLKWSKLQGGGRVIAVGNVDNDPALEIVTSANGEAGYVLDGVTGSIEWTYEDSFGAIVRLSDLDNDGMQEIVGAYSRYKISVFNADLKNQDWEISTPNTIDALIVADSDGDYVPEIIYYEGRYDYITAFDVISKEEKWSVHNPERDITNMILSDVDHDGAMEVIWGVDSNYSDYELLVADVQSGLIEWQNCNLYGLSALAVNDVNQDDIDDIVMVSRDSGGGFSGGMINIFNARTHEQNVPISMGHLDDLYKYRIVATGDVDGDSHIEIVTNSERFSSVIRVYDGTTSELKGQTEEVHSSIFTAITIGDMDNDGKVDIIAGTGQESTGTKGIYLIAYDGSTLEEKWRSVDLGLRWGKSIYDIKLADLDKDGNPDIIASLTDHRLIVVDGVTHIIKQMIESPARALDLKDINGDGTDEILVGRNDGYIDVYDGINFSIINTLFSYDSASIDALHVEDLDGDGTDEWLVASNGFLSIFHDSDDDGLIWKSHYLGTNLGIGNQITVKDTDQNDLPDIFAGSDSEMYHFEFLGVQ